tara:strand:- start:2120 stop:3961 length:1842 start_codon:yes stop_codon:yes gene_type:complete
VIRALGTTLFLSVTALTVFTAAAQPSHGIAMHGDLKYSKDFKHFDYVNPNAPKGGEVKLAGRRGFDTFNPHVIKGRPAAGLGHLYETLMTGSADEAFSSYGLLAETVVTPEDRTWVEFTLRADAKWHDGKPIMVEDVIWTFNMLKSKGRPFYRYYYSDVEKPFKTGERKVRFNFKGGVNRELPLIVGQLPVLPKHYWDGKDFEATTLEPPIGSGPYRIKEFEANRHIVYERVPNYWGKNHPTQVGFNNFDRIRYDYYRDASVAVEAFKSGSFDFRSENASKVWATAYEIAANRDGMLIKKTFEHNRPAGMQGFVMNQRRAKFADARVRRALAYAFDFEWSNKALFYGQYVRTRSYFDNSELASVGVPKGDVLKILEKYRGLIPNEVFTTAYEPPKSDGSGNIRQNLRKALKLFNLAGWDVDPKTKKLTKTESGETMTFEVLLVSPLFERIILPYIRNLKRVGIDAKVRTVDSAQYKKRTEIFDFDVVVSGWGQSASPGNEQRNYWGTGAADRAASRNLMGVKDPVLDELIELIIAAPDRKSLVTRVRALDSVLQWKHLVIPNWHIPYDRLVFWNRFGQPIKTPDQGTQFMAWWIDPAKDAKLAQYRRSTPKSN